MDIYQYLRPAQDTRLGVHWSPGRPTVIGVDAVRNNWLPLLKALGIKWVKMLHPDGLPLAELLIENDIMPVVRLYRDRPNSRDPEKGVLGPSERAALADYVAVGVRYFEFNNEPDIVAEWMDGLPDPQTAEQIVARNAICDMEVILKAGGYPAIPATAVSTRWDLLGEIIKQGGGDLLEGPVWWAIHNYDINHPLDYPYDDVNQNGRQITEAVCQALGTEAWKGHTWGERDCATVNRYRRDGVNPGDTIFDDNTGWLAYTYFDGLALQHLGRHIPILSTENGPIIGEDDDPRYPTTTAESHRDKILTIARIMMGSDEHNEQAPDYYFCTAFWLLADEKLGARGAWERNAWVSDVWPGGQLPVVGALQELPKKAWVLIGEGGGSKQQSSISGKALGGDGLILRLRSTDYLEDREIEKEEYTFADLGPGVYTLSVLGSEIEHEGLVLNGSNLLTVDLDLSALQRQSVIYGHVLHAEGYRLRLRGPVRRTRTLPADGHYRFTRLPTGRYTLEVKEGDLLYRGIVLDGRNQVEVNLDLHPALTWNFRVKDGGPGPGFAVVRCSVEGEPDLSVRLWADGWAGTSQLTGSKTEYGPYACEFAPLGGGRYYLEPAQIGVRVTLELPAARVTWVEFFQQAVSGPADNSVIEGVVENGAGYTLRLSGPQSDSLDLTAGGRFRFANLPAGRYSLAVVGTQVGRSDIEMNGYNATTIRLALLAPERSVVRGTVTGRAKARLVLSSITNQWTAQADEDGSYAFVGLPAGEYALRVVGTDLQRTNIQLDGQNEVQADFAVPQQPEAAENWGYQVSDGGPGPGFGVLRCRVRGVPDLAVHLWAEGWHGITQITGSKAEYGNDVCEFAPLGSGYYFLRPEGLGVTASVLVDGQRVLWVVFENANLSDHTPYKPAEG